MRHDTWYVVVESETVCNSPARDFWSILQYDVPECKKVIQLAIRIPSVRIVNHFEIRLKLGLHGNCVQNVHKKITMKLSQFAMCSAAGCLWLHSQDLNVWHDYNYDDQYLGNTYMILCSDFWTKMPEERVTGKNWYHKIDTVTVGGKNRYHNVILLSDIRRKSTQRAPS